MLPFMPSVFPLKTGPVVFLYPTVPLLPPLLKPCPLLFLFLPPHPQPRPLRPLIRVLSVLVACAVVELVLPGVMAVEGVLLLILERYVLGCSEDLVSVSC